MSAVRSDDGDVREVVVSGNSAHTYATHMLWNRFGTGWKSTTGRRWDSFRGWVIDIECVHDLEPGFVKEFLCRPFSGCKRERDDEFGDDEARHKRRKEFAERKKLQLKEHAVEMDQIEPAQRWWRKWGAPWSHAPSVGEDSTRFTRAEAMRVERGPDVMPDNECIEVLSSVLDRFTRTPPSHVLAACKKALRNRDLWEWLKVIGNDFKSRNNLKMPLNTSTRCRDPLCMCIYQKNPSIATGDLCDAVYRVWRDCEERGDKEGEIVFLGLKQALSAFLPVSPRSKDVATREAVDHAFKEAYVKSQWSVRDEGDDGAVGCGSACMDERWKRAEVSAALHIAQLMWRRYPTTARCLNTIKHWTFGSLLY